MRKLRVLITNNTLDNPAGSELYVRDVALGLIKRGHTPIAYSTKLGQVAKDIRAAAIPVIDNLDALGEPPDVIHGQHHLETMTALLRFPGVPAVSFCHGWLPWEENPPRFPRILRYVAVDYACRDRLIFEHAIPEERVRVLLNFVDLERFKPRGPLPDQPRRALIFSHNANEYTQIPAVREACARFGLTMDIIGIGAGNVCARPEEILGDYDLVFARGRSAIESLAVGAAVILCDKEGVGPMVTTRDFERLRPLNFGLRAMIEPITVDAIGRQIARYDAEDAKNVSQLIRTNAGSDVRVDQIVSLYREVIAENEIIGKPDGEGEARTAAAYLRWLGTTAKAVYVMEKRASSAEAALTQVRTECDQVRGLLVERDQTLQSLSTQSKEGQDQFSREFALKEGNIAELSLKLGTRESQLAVVTSRLAEKENQLAQQREAMEKLSLTAEARESQFEEVANRLAEKENQFERLTNSLGWRVVNRFGPLKHGVLLPAYRSIGRVFKTGRTARNHKHG